MQNKLIKEIENISHIHVYNKGYAKICNNFKFLHSTYTKLTLAGRKNIWRIQLSKDIKESLANVIFTCTKFGLANCLQFAKLLCYMVINNLKNTYMHIKNATAKVVPRHVLRSVPFPFKF